MLQPISVLRGGHGTAGVSCGIFFALDSRYFLLTGDDAGKVVLWNMNTRRQFSSTALDSPVLNILKYGTNAIKFIVQLKSGFLRLLNYDFDSFALKVCPLEPVKVGGFSFCQIQSFENDSGDFFLVAPSSKGPEYLSLVTFDENFNHRIVIADIGSEGTGMCLACKIVTVSSHSFLIAVYDDGSMMIHKCTPSSGIFETVLTAQIFPTTATAIDYAKGKIYLCSAQNCIAMVEGIDFTNEQFSDWIVTKSDHPLSNTGTAGIVAFPQLPFAFSAGWDTRIRVFASESLRHLGYLQGHSDTVLSLLAVPKIDGDGLPDVKLPLKRHKSLLIGFGQDSIISLWNPEEILK